MPFAWIRRNGVQLFLTSFLGLYAELLCIRWIPAYVRFISYFTNFILLASFLGLGVGILSARRPLRVGFGLFPWLLLAIVGLVAVSRFELHIESAGVLYYGASEGGAAPRENAIVLPAAFLLVALLFACVGRPLGQLLSQVTPPLRAYALDIGGSLAGVAAFFCLSLTQQPPVVWFAVLLVVVLLLTRPRWYSWVLAAAPVLVSLVVANAMGSGYWWSPYYKVGLTPLPDHTDSWVLTVNNIGHQIMQTAEEKEPFYRAPYEIFGPGAFRKALIIGAGSGSDVSVALHNGVQQVDAVEIDPVIMRLGQQYHPDQPFSDPRVTRHVDDGRAFLRRSTDKYDLIVFALPDSLTLTSQFASLRLESFLFTEQAMREARDHLTDGGVVVLYNFYRQTWLLRKLAGMLESAFDRPPYVVSYGGWGRAAVLIDGPRLWAAPAFSPELAEPYREGPQVTMQLEDDPDAVLLPVLGRGLLDRNNPAGDDGGSIQPSLATDDWPLMYLPVPGVPGVYLAGLAMAAVCALGLVLLLGFGPGSIRRGETWRGFNGQMFALGAAFMLLETRSLVSFGLLFGNTWLISSLVFFAILCSVLLAVLVSARIDARPGVGLYACLVVALLLAYVVPDGALLAIDPPALRYAVASLIAFLPIFLANLVFAGSFKLTGREADLAFASNLLGAMLGGMLEYTALLYGYRHLLILATGAYLAAMALDWWRPIRPALLPVILSRQPSTRAAGAQGVSYETLRSKNPLSRTPVPETDPSDAPGPHQRQGLLPRVRS